jgi:hypothetical protein
LVVSKYDLALHTLVTGVMVIPHGRMPASLAATLDAGDRGVIVNPLAKTVVPGFTTGEAAK